MFDMRFLALVPNLSIIGTVGPFGEVVETRTKLSTSTKALFYVHLETAKRATKQR